MGFQNIGDGSCTIGSAAGLHDWRILEGILGMIELISTEDRIFVTTAGFSVTDK
jgi:hypothetical protein